MISEKKIVNDFNSFWHGLTPTMPQLILRINQKAIKFRKPVKLISHHDLRGLVNETAFNISFMRNELIIKGHSFLVNREVFQTSKINAWKKISRLDGTSEPMPSIDEFEVRELYESFESFLQEYRNNQITITFKPKYKGCGFLNLCEGDVVIGDTLFEIKAGNRNFRGPDVRQLLVYLSLNFYSSGFLYKNVGLVNPRTGKYVVYDVDELSYLLTGKTGLDLVNEILIFLLGYGISK